MCNGQTRAPPPPPSPAAATHSELRCAREEREGAAHPPERRGHVRLLCASLVARKRQEVRRCHAEELRAHLQWRGCEGVRRSAQTIGHKGVRAHVQQYSGHNGVLNEQCNPAQHKRKELPRTRSDRRTASPMSAATLKPSPTSVTLSENAVVSATKLRTFVISACVCARVCVSA